ncbi:MAG TPA: type II toxin-antitoxin system VapC family toxin [Streptosporangiaceae bacterium]
MRLHDVNVLINAYRPEDGQHKQFRAVIEKTIQGEEAYAVSDVVLAGFIRVVTNKRIFKEPTRLSEAIEFAETVRNQPHAVVINPGPRFWGIFTTLCVVADAKAKLVPDAYLAALAIEHGCEFVTADRDFAKFPELRWRHPLN